MKLLNCLMFVVFMFLGSASMSQTKPKQIKDTTHINTADTNYVIKSGIKYEIHIGARGGKYIIRTSKSGTTYKQYIKQ